MKIYHQEWLCECCLKKGFVTYNDLEKDVVTVAYKLLDDHAAVSPHCPGGMRDIRVINNERQAGAEVR